VLKPKVKGVYVVTFVNICIIFFISGMALRTDEVKAALTRKTLPGERYPGVRMEPSYATSWYLSVSSLV
jgi:hypothetical protein